MPSTIRSKRTFFAVALVGVLALSGCSSAGPLDTAAPDKSNGSAKSSNPAKDDAGDGAVVAGGLGKPVTFKVMPKLSPDDVARVTVNSFGFEPEADFEKFNPKNPIDRDGLLVINITWETLEGSTQSNDAYFRVASADGTEGIRLAVNLDGSIKNGRVQADAPKTGNIAFAVNKGASELFLMNMHDEDVARWAVNTGKL